MATFTATTLSNPSVSRAPGVHVRVFERESGTLIGSAGDVVLLCKIPNGAYILDVAFAGRAGGAGSPSFVFHARHPRSSVTSTVISTTLSATLGMRSIAQAGYDNGPVKISISSDQTLPYAILGVVVIPGAAGAGTLTATTSFFVKGYVTFAWNV